MPISPSQYQAALGPPKTRITVSVSEAVLTCVDLEAARQDRSRSWIVEQAIKLYLAMETGNKE